MQSYPSRTKDKIPVDFSTGSVGLGVAITAFASLVQDYLTAHGMMDEADRGRFVALIGDAELDEGNIYECLIEALQARHPQLLVDRRLQPPEPRRDQRRPHVRAVRRDFPQLRLAGGRAALRQEAGGRARPSIRRSSRLARRAAQRRSCRRCIYQGGAAWRARIEADLGKTAAAFLKAHDDDALAALMTDLGGHCMETLVEAFDAAQDDVPTLFIAWTIKGFGLPFAGHKDNHAGLMNPTQMAALRDAMGVAEGRGMGAARRASATMPGRASRRCSSAAGSPGRSAPRASASVADPGHPRARRATSNRPRPRSAGSCSTSPRPAAPLADRIVTTSPDVTVSTNLGAWVNQRGLFRRREMADVFAEAKIAVCAKMVGAQTRASISSSGIAENNLFLMLAALGLSGDLFGQRLFPIGTLYDPFIARGLDSLNYACYQDARFLLVATPSAA